MNLAITLFSLMYYFLNKYPLLSYTRVNTKCLRRKENSDLINRRLKGDRLMIRYVSKRENVGSLMTIKGVNDC